MLNNMCPFLFEFSATHILFDSTGWHGLLSHIPDLYDGQFFKRHMKHVPFSHVSHRLTVSSNIVNIYLDVHRAYYIAATTIKKNVAAGNVVQEWLAYLDKLPTVAVKDANVIFALSPLCQCQKLAVWTECHACHTTEFNRSQCKIDYNGWITCWITAESHWPRYCNYYVTS